MQLINLNTSPVYLSELRFAFFLITADKSRRKEMNIRRLCLCAGMWMSHMYVQMTKCVCMCAPAPASPGGNICCRVSEATCRTPSC